MSTPDRPADDCGFSRRSLIRRAAIGGGVLALGSSTLLKPSLERKGLLSADGVFGAASEAWADQIYTEAFPTSPLILNPFSDSRNPDHPELDNQMTIPPALRPVPPTEYQGWASPPSGAEGKQNSHGNETHQIWPTNDKVSQTGYYKTSTLPDNPMNVTPECKKAPLVYKIDVKVAEHSFTDSNVLPIDSLGKPTSYYVNGKPVAPPSRSVGVPLPKSTIYSFNGTFPGSRINAQYGQPALIRFENKLNENPLGLPRQDFGAPDRSFLTHLHNGHTAPESDGNPHYSMRYGPQHHGYLPGAWCDNLYLNWPAGGDDREKQSFFWFHDHRMDQTGANVYKGMVGLYPIYDPKGDLDNGDETKGLRLPGVRRDNLDASGSKDGSFEVDYDIPIALYDCRLDDGNTVHHDVHDSEFANPPVDTDKQPVVPNIKHPEWWGKTFFKHFPNHGFTGDIFTVNGKAYPTLHVQRRRYRFRFLDASISRIYELKLMKSAAGPKAAIDLGYTGNDLQGQYRLPDGQQALKFMQIASDGGLLPKAVERDSFELWPAKRREFVVDFSKTSEKVIYLTNVMKMPDGRMWTNSSRFSPDPNYKVPLLKIVIDDGPVVDNSADIQNGTPLRDLPDKLSKIAPADLQKMIDNRLIFEVQRGAAGGEIEWLINGKAFDPTKPAMSLQNPVGKTLPATQPRDSFAVWEIRNGGGGWVHPFHLHMEEHRTIRRNGKDLNGVADSGHPDDISREDLVALDPSESVLIFRGFRDFVGPYVAHCHNLAHEDHAMMFGWEITP
jgi:FtsP/CotA-like multicopper oxidase with cupredoxin domain